MANQERSEETEAADDPWISLVPASVRGHPGTAIVVGVAYVYVATLLGLAKFESDIAIAIARDTDPATIGFSVLLFITPFAVALIVLHQLYGPSGIAGDKSQLLKGITLFAILIAATASLPWWLSVGYLAGYCLIFGYEMTSRKRFSVRTALPNEMQRSLWLMWLTMLLGAPLLVGSSALPYEAISLGENEPFTAQVVSDDGDSLVLLIDNGSQLLRVNSILVSERQYCDASGSKTLREVLARGPVGAADCPD